jgi:hypothetical protein
MIYYKKSMEINEDKLGIDHINTLTSYNNVGEMYKALG